MSEANDFHRLWQHENGVWYIIWSGNSERGQLSRGSRRISTRTTDRREAEQYRAQYIAGLNEKLVTTEPTIEWVLERYWQERGPQTRSQATMKESVKELRSFFGDLLPSHVTNRLLRLYADKNRVLSAGTILRRLGVLKAALRYAEGNRWIEPLPPLKMPVKHPAPRDIWLTRAQVGQLIEQAKSPHIELFIKLAINTAARTGAILDLTWAQTNFEHRLIDFGRGWGNKRRAIVPMNDEVHSILVRARELAQTEHVIEFNGKPIRSIKAAFRRLCGDCGIKASAHVLRHTAATWLVMDGVPLRQVARLLGNSEAMVEKVYGKHSPEYLRGAVLALNTGASRLKTPQP